MIVDINRLIDFYTDRLVTLGIEEPRSRAMARAQVEVHAFGTDTHGLPPLQNMLNSIRKRPEHIVPPVVKSEFGALLVADCSRTPAVEPILWGSEKAAGLADLHGLGFVSLTNGGWVGTMGYHLAYWARKGYLMMSWNQSSDVPLTPPFGGKEARFNTNPMAFSFPLGTGGYKENPLVADFSTAAISYGKTLRLARSGEKTPEKLYLDRDGIPSDNARVTKRGGTIMPFGGEHYGFRGTALAYLIEAMTAAAGAMPANRNSEGGQNVHVFALKIDALGGMEGYDVLMTQLSDWILATEPVPGGSGVRYPGQRGWTALKKSRAEGVVIEGELEALVFKEGFKG
ncbi:MAG: Ldh family oxidoreductase [Spirochaetales bacterium]|nr:Ldh family oxidoreductase [Spirochaetales bacterium]